MARLPVSAAAIGKLLKEIESSGGGEHFLAIGGASELAAALQQQFLRGSAEPGAVRLGGPKGADVYVHVLASERGREDLTVLRRARRARVPVVEVARGGARAGEAFPLEQIARKIAVRLGEDGAPLAGRVPPLREAVCEQLVASFSRKNGVLAAAIWIPGADLPVLALNELRLVSRLAQAYGSDSGRELVPEFAATLGAAFGLRALARELLDLVPFAGWAVKGTLAYAGTRALGEAACKRFALASTPPPA